MIPCYAVPAMFTLLSSFCIWTKNLTYISQLTSNNIISCCKSDSELCPLKTPTAETRWELYIVFTSVFPIIHCATYAYIYIYIYIYIYMMKNHCCNFKISNFLLSLCGRKSKFKKRTERNDNYCWNGFHRGEFLDSKGKTRKIALNLLKILC